MLKESFLIHILGLLYKCVSEVCKHWRISLPPPPFDFGGEDLGIITIAFSCFGISEILSSIKGFLRQFVFEGGAAACRAHGGNLIYHLRFQTSSILWLLCYSHELRPLAKVHAWISFDSLPFLWHRCFLGNQNQRIRNILTLSLGTAENMSPCSVSSLPSGCANSAKACIIHHEMCHH